MSGKRGRGTRGGGSKEARKDLESVSRGRDVEEGIKKEKIARVDARQG